LSDKPHLSLTQIKHYLVHQYGLLPNEVGDVFPSLGTVYYKARKEALEFEKRKKKMITAK
jgi:hypothetical protein